MKLAANYSSPTSDLLQSGQIQIDCFKCPAWPDLVTTVQEIYPTYVHFPLRVGMGIGDAIDTETNQPADWRKVEKLLAQTDTPYVNVHLAPTVHDHPDMPVDMTDPVDSERLVESVLKDLRAVANRFGANQVIVENIHGFADINLRAAYSSELISRVLEETDCGFLLDLSHARLAALQLGLDAQQYVSGMPVSRIREIHITGIHRFEGQWVKRLRQAGLEDKLIQPFIGRWVEHLPMTGKDWEFFTWSMDQIHNGVWAKPWVVTFEYGGVSRLYKSVTDADVLAEQIPRIYSIVKGKS